MIVKSRIRNEDLSKPFIKAVVDIKRKAFSIACDLHIDCAEELIKDGSNSDDLWGINIYPDRRIDYVSLVNIRPVDDNRTMEIKNQEIRDIIAEIVNSHL